MLHLYSDPPEHAARTIYLTADELKQLLHFWTARLGLQAWQLSLHVTAAVDMPGAVGAQGASQSSYPLRRATLHLLDPRDHRPDQHLAYDMETTLVHELLHVLNAPMQNIARGTLDAAPRALEDTCMEHVVEQLSVALVALRRATETKKNRLGVYRD